MKEEILLKLNRTEFYKIYELFEDRINDYFQCDPVLYDIEDKFKQIRKMYEL